MAENSKFDSFLEDINSMTWVFAKTMPQIPHWYVVRYSKDEDTWVRLFNFIGEYG